MSARTKIAGAALLVVALLALAWMTLITGLGPASEPIAATQSVSGGGITLVSDRIALPADTAALPVGSDGITANCTACHSAEMLLTQPKMPAEKWQATIDKMRGVYKAPIAPADDRALIVELLALPAQGPNPTPPSSRP